MRAIRERPSPNHDGRPPGKPTDLLLIHYTGMRDSGAAVQRMTDPASKVSSHYLIDEDGTVYRLVEESRRAWHAGVGYWAGERDINAVFHYVPLHASAAGRAFGRAHGSLPHRYGCPSASRPSSTARYETT